MWQDPIVEEVHKIRDAHAAKHNYSLKAIYEALKEEEAKSKHEFIKLPPKLVKEEVQSA
ncbi:MAG: hypothetical protein MJA27_17990 [Pseudanabaenales cyanobacterium]|nr:hypothetical protein [Pseudanabaenales cyanobacterium]